MKTGRIIVGAAVLGIAAGLAGIYGMGALEGNGAAAECMADEGRLAAMRPLARGEVAAFAVADAPDPLPPLAFSDADGAPVSLADWAGKTVVFNLWATWCAPCREEMPALDALQAGMGGEDLDVVAVSIDREEAQAAAFLDEIGIDALGLYTDPESATFRALQSQGRAFGMPTTLIVDEAGCALGHLAGPAEWNSQDARALVAAAMGRERP